MPGSTRPTATSSAKCVRRSRISSAFDRTGIDPFTDRFPVTLRLEGTVRGTGGLVLSTTIARSSVAGLYAAGDACHRELICGGFTGGGSHNAAWAMSSGTWAGQGAATLPDRSDRRGSDRYRAPVRLHCASAPSGLSTGGAGESRSGRSVSLRTELLPRGGPSGRSLERLDALWAAASQADAAAESDLLRARESAAMLATARGCTAAAWRGRKGRGMHRRDDFPNQDDRQRHLHHGGRAR